MRPCEHCGKVDQTVRYHFYARIWDMLCSECLEKELKRIAEFRGNERWTPLP